MKPSSIRYGLRYAQWLKEPFRIGHPLPAEASYWHNKLLQVLFQHHSDPQLISQLCTKFEIDPRILDGSDLSISQIYTEAVPKRLEGEQLFRQQYNGVHLRLAHIFKRIDTKRFFDPKYVQNAYETRVRTWQGQQIVEFLLRFSSEKWNPYYYLNLMPWEIIQDKLKSVKNRFESDYYDTLIDQAFSTRDMQQIHYAEQKPDDFSGASTLISLSSLTPDQRFHLYRKVAARKTHEFFVQHPPPPRGTAYLQYLQQQWQHSDQELFQAFVQTALHSWNSMSSAEKSQYQANNYPYVALKLLRTRWKLAVVLDYIYDVNLSPFDWRAQLPPKLYANGYYLDRYYSCTDNHVTEIDVDAIFQARSFT